MYGSSCGYGFVQYEMAEAAQNAIKHVNGMLLNEMKVFVGHHISKKDCQSKFDELKANFTHVYVRMSKARSPMRTLVNFLQDWCHHGCNYFSR